jgi:hypothetical protein
MQHFTGTARIQLRISSFEAAINVKNQVLFKEVSDLFH